MDQKPHVPSGNTTSNDSPKCSRHRGGASPFKVEGLALSDVYQAATSQRAGARTLFLRLKQRLTKRARPSLFPPDPCASVSICGPNVETRNPSHSFLS